MSHTAVDQFSSGALARSLVFARTTVRHHAWFLACALAYILVVVLLLEALDRPYRIADRFYLLTALVPPFLAAICVVIGQTLFHVLHVRPFSLSSMLREMRSDDKLRVSRLAYAGIPILAVVAFQSAFTSFKSSITVINPFQYDLLFMEIDRWLHFGRHPWEWLHPLLGYPLVTSAVSFAYKIWYGTFYLIFFWMAFSMQDPLLRMRYLLSYLLCWILIGSVAATMLSSAGPCFFGFVVDGPDPYARLLAYLQAAGQEHQNWSLFAQQYLWESYAQQRLDVGSGISAMPSMHVAIAVLQALLGWRISRRLGWLLTIYCGFVLIGSVHQGWHYAIDGYLSILAVIVIWKAVGWALRFHPSFAWGQEEPPGDQQAAPAR